MSFWADSRSPHYSIQDRRRCVILGAAGFLGRHLARHFSTNGISVLGLGHGPSPGGEWGIDTFAQCNLPDPCLADRLSQWNPDVCIYAVGPGEVAIPPDELESNGIDPTTAWLSVLDAVAASVPGCRIVLLSSASVYGRPECLPISEEHPIRPVSEYGRLKVACENLAIGYGARHGLSISIARIFNAYGPHQRRQVLWDLCEKARKSTGGGVELMGDGSESRDFIHVYDIADAIFRIAQSDHETCSVWNVGSGVPISIREAAEAVAEWWPEPLQIQFNGVRSATDIDRSQADIASLRSLGFEPSRGWVGGFREYVEWYLNAVSRTAEV